MFNQAFESMKPTLNKLPLSAQKAYVELMLDFIARALVSASRTDKEIQKELTGFKTNMTIQMRVLPHVAEFTLRITPEGTFKRLSIQEKPKKPDLSMQFKHISLAYLVLSFQEGTARAFASDRVVADGDLGDAIRFVRCLNRVEAIILPKALASLAVKAYPKLHLREKLATAARIYAGTAKSFLNH